MFTEETQTPAPADVETAPEKPAAPAFDLEKLTLGEIAKLEDLSGLPMAKFADMENNPQGKVMAAMVFVAERRKGNAISWPDCLALGMEDAMDRLGMKAPGVPADGAAADADNEGSDFPN